MAIVCNLSKYAHTHIFGQLHDTIWQKYIDEDRMARCSMKELVKCARKLPKNISLYMTVAVYLMNWHKIFITSYSIFWKFTLLMKCIFNRKTTRNTRTKHLFPTFLYWQVHIWIFHTWVIIYINIIIYLHMLTIFFIFTLIFNTFSYYIKFVILNRKDVSRFISSKSVYCIIQT